MKLKRELVVITVIVILATIQSAISEPNYMIHFTSVTLQSPDSMCNVVVYSVSEFDGLVSRSKSYLSCDKTSGDVGFEIEYLDAYATRYAVFVDTGTRVGVGVTIMPNTTDYVTHYFDTPRGITRLVFNVSGISLGNFSFNIVVFGNQRLNFRGRKEADVMVINPSISPMSTFTVELNYTIDVNGYVYRLENVTAPSGVTVNNYTLTVTPNYLNETYIVDVSYKLIKTPEPIQQTESQEQQSEESGSEEPGTSYLIYGIVGGMIVTGLIAGFLVGNKVPLVVNNEDYSWVEV